MADPHKPPQQQCAPALMQRHHGSYSQIIRTKIEKLQFEAHQLQIEGRLEEAVKRINRGLSLAPRNPDLYHHRAEILVLMGDLALALRNIEKALSLKHPDSTQLLERLADVHALHGGQFERLDDYASALSAYSEASKIAPHCHDYTFKRITCLMKLGRFDDCLSLTEAELHKSPMNISLLTTRAKLKMMFGNMTQAFYSVQKALQLEPENKMAIDMREELNRQAMTAKEQAVYYCLSGKEKEAIKKLTAAIQADPTNPSYHILRGALHRQAGRFTTAVDDYLTAIDKCSHRRDSTVYKDASRQLVLTYNDFAVDCFRRNHYQDAVTLLNKALKEEKNEPALYTNRGDCFFKLKELRFALADYQQACELRGVADIGLCYRLAVVNHSIGNELFNNAEYQAAESYFTQSIAHSPLTGHFYQCRARARYELKDNYGAREDTLKALLLDPGDKSSIPLIARLFPGKTASELYHSDLANDLRPSLLPPKHQQSGQTESTGRASLLNKLLEELTICTTEEEEKEKSGEKKENDVAESGSAHSGTTLSSPPQLPTSPRLFSVLNLPCPPLTDSNAVVPSLQECLKEDEFHRQICCAKKLCTQHVQRLFQHTTTSSSS